MSQLDKNGNVKCSCCGDMFNPSAAGVVGQINGKPVAYCTPCCRKDEE